MSTKIFKIKAAPAGTGPKSLKEALELAEKTGVLELPQEALRLTVNSGQPVGVAHGK